MGFEPRKKMARTVNVLAVSYTTYLTKTFIHSAGLECRYVYSVSGSPINFFSEFHEYIVILYGKTRSSQIIYQFYVGIMYLSN
jgi:hypothetical protein